jgi:hypothetical protein
MTENIPPKAVCPIGELTILKSIKAGYADLTMALVALYENGYLPNDIISRRQLTDLGIVVDIAKTIMNQCEGREFDKKKGPKMTKRKAKGKNLTHQEEMDLAGIIRDLSQRNRFLDSFQSNDKQIAHLINAEDNSPENSLIRINPPKPSAVKALFSNFQYANQSPSLDLSPFKASHGRGRPSRLFVIPTLDEYAKLFGVTTPDAHQFHYEISGHRTSKTFKDAVHLACMERNQNGEKNEHPMRKLCNMQGDSPKTVRARNKRVGIKVKHNFFSYPVSPLGQKGLLRRCRGDCWLEMELPELVLPGNTAPGKGTRVRPHYPVSEAGLAMAKREWENAGSPGDFDKFLRIGGYLANSYILPKKFSDS